ncbi:unnamed protein product [Rhodiola kirilowii]
MREFARRFLISYHTTNSATRLAYLRFYFQQLKAYDDV